MVDFTSILNKKAVEVEKPKPLPTGTYRVSGLGVPAQREVKTKEGERAVLSFKCKILEAVEVDADQLETYGDLSGAFPLARDIFIDGQGGDYQLRQFLEGTCGISPGTPDDPRTLGEMCGDYPGCQFLVVVEHRPYTDAAGQPAIQAQIKSTAAL